MQTSLHAIAQLAQRDKQKRFKSLYSFLNRKMLGEAYRHLNKKAAPGVDDLTYEEYGKNLEENLIDLETRLKQKRYRAKVVRRVHIPKGNGKTRPLGIPVLEDKLVQWVVREILQALFEPLFYEHSYGYRPKRSARQAVEGLWNKLMGTYRIVVEVDIESFFDTIDHQWMVKMVEKRINDKSIIWLIKQWLRAGIMMEDGSTENPERGTPQGGVVSPILANIYLHYVLDLWFQIEVRKHSKSDIALVRYADDFVAAFRMKADADRFYEWLPERFAKFGLTLSDEKTRKMQVKAKLRGHKNYFGIQGNSSCIKQVARGTIAILFKWLNRRSQRKSYTWQTFEQMLKHYNFHSWAIIRNDGVQLSFL